ncbi:RDD family protein [Auritidibacter ignavus]|uniref:RDD family protein n=1 Tax=Auritidibacter ignavus TaxID=678932 RepID=A0AAJ6APX0_9MICC|nr:MULTISPECIES: RDD family protein [Auritidibacter]PXA76409.1 RDD family protein [Auritidibacter sp. NML100628]WGH93955.1 RDD family protein [Auritidibacter ignavus]
MSAEHRREDNAEDPLISRKDLASWVEGPPGEQDTYPGERLGLPRTGPSSVASLGRRVGALFSDWFISVGLAWLVGSDQPWLPLLFFVMMHWLLVGLLGATIGKALFRIQVVRVGGASVGLWQAAIRALLLGLFIPAIVMDKDQRGVHDLLAKTVVITA